MSSFLILRQPSVSLVEGRLAVQYAMTENAKTLAVSLEQLEAHTEELASGKAMPLGSVEFVRHAMALAGVTEPENLSYPASLMPFLHRDVQLQQVSALQGRVFVKPAATKAFTGFVLDPSSAPSDDFAKEQEQALQALPGSTQVWVASPVTWLCEHRAYVLDGHIAGVGRYDEHEDERPEPDWREVSAMVEAFVSSSEAPVSFGLDVGVLSTGETALVECNDAWALGYYKGTLGYKDYIRMLWRRWQQMRGQADLPS